MSLYGSFGVENPNANWLNQRGVWLTYLVCIAIVHVVLLVMPFWSVPVVWTLTNVVHNVVMFIVLHTLKGTPWESGEQGKFRRYTHWEQIDNGVQFTATRKFFTIIPILLFFITNAYTKYDPIHMSINAFSLIVILIPKLPQLHGVRLFGINKY